MTHVKDICLHILDKYICVCVPSTHVDITIHFTWTLQMTSLEKTSDFTVDKTSDFTSVAHHKHMAHSS